MDETEQELKRRKAEEAHWRELVERHFHFLLTDYGFEIVKVDASSAWETVLIYQSSAVAVRVTNSREYNRAEVSMIRLVDGEIPPYPVFFLPESILNQTLLDMIVGFRTRGKLAPRFDELKGRSDEQLDATLAFLADATHAYATDVLAGDFTIFEEIQTFLRARARARAPKVTIWKPADTSTEQVGQAAESTRHTPSGVEVETRLYTKPGDPERKKLSKQLGDMAKADDGSPPETR